MIGPSTFLPGVTSISPVFGLISTGMLFPSSSFAVTFVSLSGFTTLIPVPCLSFVGSTGCLPLVSTEVLLTDGVVSAFPVFAVASSDVVFPSTVALAFTTSFSFGSLPAGTFAVHLPS